MKQIVCNPCKRCGVCPRYDTDGFCNNCLDELGLSEFSYLEKEYQRGFISKKKFIRKLNQILQKEPPLIAVRVGS